VHNLLDVQNQLRTLEQWKADGRVRYIGVSHYTVTAYDELARIVSERAIDFVQFNYNIAERAAERRLLPLAMERNVAVIVNRPFEEGELFEQVRGRPLPDWAGEICCASWAQFFLKFILSHPAVTCVIPATGKPEHLADNMQAGLGRMPDAKLRELMARTFAAL
jgi:diketogulonate reductase-like aldo/keto reductase